MAKFKIIVEVDKDVIGAAMGMQDNPDATVEDALTDFMASDIVEGLGIKLVTLEGDNNAADQIVHDNVGKMLENAKDLKTALKESVYLQSFYALQLNMLDGGKRIGFADEEAWLARLRETGKIK